MSILIKNIRSLVQTDDSARNKISGKEMSALNCIEHAFLSIEGGVIRDFGPMKSYPSDQKPSFEIDASGKFVLPCWCDSHTHLVYASSREQEFVDRIKGLTYEDIASRGGGIINSAKKLMDASEEDLYRSAWNRMNEMMMQGTGAVEIKSGYGLDTKNELKMLRVIKRLKENHPLTVRSTFLGAHAVPAGMKKEEYIDLLIKEMIPRVAEEKLADYCDVFCERGYFSESETEIILSAAADHGMIPKVHANQLSRSGGVQAGVKVNAISVDHLEYVDEEEIQCLLNSQTMPTILPGAQFFLQLPHPPARRMIDSGLPLAIASDYNPGSSPSGNMNFMIALACIQYHLTPEEVINAVTINSAYAMGLSDTHGSIVRGKKANVIITEKIPSLAYLPYSFGSNLTRTIIVNGEIQEKGYSL